MISSSPLPGKWAQASFRKRLGWLVRDVALTALQQLFGKRRASRRTVYWSKDRRGNWVVHVPMYRN